MSLGLAAAASTVVGPTASIAATGEDVVYIASKAPTPVTSDRPIVAAIEGAGFNVTVVDDDALGGLDLTGVEAIVVSSSVSPSKVGNRYRDTAVPLVSFEPFVFDDLGMTPSGGANLGELSGRRVFPIVDPAHPLAAGLSGSVGVTTSGAGLTWGKPLAEAEVVATLPGSASKATIFTYAEGAQMNGLAAPATRTGLFPSTTTGTRLTVEGTAIVVAAVEHAVADAAPPGNQAPVVDAGADVTIDDGETVSLAGSVSDDGLPEDPGSSTVAWSGPAEVSFADSTSASTTATISGGPGTYELTLTADDGELDAADSLTVTVLDPNAPVPTTVLYVAGTATGASTEQVAIQRLVDAGYEVTVADDNATSTADAASYDLVVISASTAAGRFGNDWRDVAVPMVVWEPWVFDQLGITSTNSAQGAASGQRDIRILDSEHPITAGFDGFVRVTSSGRSMTWARPEGEVAKLASHRNQTTKVSLFAYEEGAQMDDVPAPARRVGLFLATNSPSVLTDDGWTLFDRSIGWAMAEPKPAPVAAASADITSGEAPQTVTFDATASTGDIVTYAWDFGDGATGTGPNPSHTYQWGGSFEATLTVTDDAFQSSSATVSLTFDDPPPVAGGEDPIARYDFVRGADDSVVRDVSGNGAPLDLTIEDPGNVQWLGGGGLDIRTATRLISAGPASKVIGAVGATDEMTIEAWIDPLNTIQSGPARIVTLSNGIGGTDTINVMLGQGYKSAEGDRIEGRFRTSNTTAHAQPGVLSQDAALDGDLVHVVFTRDVNGIQRIYLNGSLSSEWEISGDIDVWDPATPLTLANDDVDSRGWRGVMHEVQIFDRALDETEVCTSAAQGPGRSVAGELAPSPCLLASTREGVAPLAVDFDGLASSDPDGSVVSHAWDFGDGASASTPAASHVFAAPGEFIVTLTVTDNDGNTRSASTTVEVADPNPAPIPTLQERSGMRVGGGYFNEAQHVERETWLGREMNWTAQFTDHRSASGMGSSSYGLFESPNADLPGVAERMNTSVSVGLAFGRTDLNNGGVEAVRENLQKTVDGEYDFLYYRVASRMVDAGYGDAVIRLGHEFNGLWAPWSSQGNEELFIEAWRHVHDLFENVSPDFRYDWGGLKEGWNATAPPAWPGDEYVDIVSQSIYWKKKQGWEVWNEDLWENRLLKPMRDAQVFAAAHGKQVAYSEWGILQVDAPEFIERMHAWMSSLPETGPGSMAYNVYWDSSGSLNRLDKVPAVEAKYKELFG
ncbi:MAG: PKD domain-containing protein [Actinomycetota bacterium]